MKFRVFALFALFFAVNATAADVRPLPAPPIVGATSYLIIDARTGDVSCYALSNEAYTVQELTNALRSAGFKDVARFPSLSGEIVDADQDLPVVVARR